MTSGECVLALRTVGSQFLQRGSPPLLDIIVPSFLIFRAGLRLATDLSSQHLGRDVVNHILHM